jgi:hypothetical protein
VIKQGGRAGGLDDSLGDAECTTCAYSSCRRRPVNWVHFQIAGITRRASVSKASQASAANEWQSHSYRKARLCRVVGCCVDLSALGKPYCLKRRECKRLNAWTACHSMT